jgi:hypothetical protein
MAISSLDTHELVKELKAAGFTEERAEAVARAAKKAKGYRLIQSGDQDRFERTARSH